jgi:CubicO group peptidase (beta-lactamase class C family)
MRIISAAVLCSLLGLAGRSPAQNRAAETRPLAQHPEVAAALQVLDVWVKATVASREQPGLSIGVVYDQELIWAKGYGFADLEKKVPATPATVYRIASISKLFTATAILHLRDAGKLGLDDPVAKHLPWYQIKDAHPGGPTVSIRHLLTHTSGLPREAVGVDWNDLKFPPRETMIQKLADQETVYAAETQWKYSNLALSLAGEIVTAVSGEPWPQYVQTHILQPLGMKATRALPGPDMPNLAVGYGRRVPGRPRDVEPFVDIAAERPAGNLASSVEDLAKFAALQLRDQPAGGSQVLKGATLREMHRVHWLWPDWKGGYGLGFRVRRAGEQTRVGHGGSLPGHRTDIEIASASKLAVIVLTNANDGDPVKYVDQAFSLLNPAVTRATAPASSAKKPDPTWEKYVGTYTWKHADVQVLMLDGELTMVLPEADNPWESRILLKPVRAHTFRLTPVGTTYAAIGELLTFELDKEGNVRRARTPNSYWVRK